MSIHIAFHQMATIRFALDKTTMNLNSILAPTGCDMRLKYHKYRGYVDNINHLLYFGVIFYPCYMSISFGIFNKWSNMMLKKL